jgi:hypothetical protein
MQHEDTCQIRFRSEYITHPRGIEGHSRLKHGEATATAGGDCWGGFGSTKWAGCRSFPWQLRPRGQLVLASALQPCTTSTSFPPPNVRFPQSLQRPWLSKCVATFSDPCRCSWRPTGPLTTLVKRSLTITNHNLQPVAFKVKTTAPKVRIAAVLSWLICLWILLQLYCVRPNSGRVEPGESVDVSGDYFLYRRRREALIHRYASF